MTNKELLMLIIFLILFLFISDLFSGDGMTLVDDYNGPIDGFEATLGF